MAAARVQALRQALSAAERVGCGTPHRAHATRAADAPRVHMLAGAVEQLAAAR